MLKKAILIVATLLSLALLWFALYNYRQAEPISEENLRGLALSLSAAIENIALHDPSLGSLSKFHPADVAYLALIDSHGRYRFHSNPELTGTTVPEKASFAELLRDAPSEKRVTLGTGERAFLFSTPVYLPGETLLLRLTLHTFRADAVIRRARLDATILLALLGVGWLLAAALLRYARREERHQMELARKEHLAKLGEVGAMLAHEIRNPLSGIKGFAQVIAKRPEEPRNARFAEKIVGETIRLENLVNELLLYAASDGPPPARFDLVELIDDTLALVAAEAAANAVLVMHERPISLLFFGVRDRVEQALLNLYRNALQAMPAGGVLEVCAATVGNAAVITVRDSGDGIEEKDLARVFDPFFTTRARGTGLGLALCSKVVEEHGGSIGISSEVAQGTTVTMTFPLRTGQGEE
jgi:two-component system, NtrC family, sensor histidine kinase HydH